MDPCEECSLDDKIYECCGRCPDTGATISMVMEPSRRLAVCPHLTRQGKCAIYEQRPARCRSFYCLKYNQGYSFQGERWRTRPLD